MYIGSLLEQIATLPKKAREEFTKLLKLSSKTQSYVGGVVLIAMYLLEFLGIPQLIDEAFDEEYTPIKIMKAKHKENPDSPPIPSSGMVLALLIADMIAHPKKLTRIYKVEDVATIWNTGLLMGLEPRILNDDRILTALTKLGSEPEKMNDILHSLVIITSEKFKIPLKRFFMDTTVLELEGDYENVDKIRAGRGKNSFSQIILSLTATAGSRLPIGFDVLPGNTSDCTTFEQSFSHIEKVTSNTEGDVDIIFDRIYGSAKNLFFLTDKNSEENDKNYYFICPLKVGNSGERFEELLKEAYQETFCETEGILKNNWEEIEYRSQKEEKKDISPPLTAFETQWEIKEPSATKKEQTTKKTTDKRKQKVRCILYRHELNAIKAKERREEQITKVNSLLADLNIKLNKWKYTTIEECNKKRDNIMLKFKDLKDCIQIIFSKDEQGIISMTCKWDNELLEEKEKSDGVFGLLTNYKEKDKNDGDNNATNAKDANDVLTLYRERDQIEVNFKDLKGILEVEEMYLRREERIDAYVFLKVLAYFVLTFLKFYVKEHANINITPKKIVEELGTVVVTETKLEPIEISYYASGNETEFTKFIAQEFNLPHIQSVIEELNLESQIEIESSIKIWLGRWLKNNQNRDG